MGKQSTTENVRKRCGCRKWKTCTHPWYLDFQEKGVRYRDNLDKLIGRHAPDFNQATNEARRAITAKLEGRDPRGLLPEDDPTLKQVLEAFADEKPRQDKWQIPKILATELRSPTGMKPFGEWRASAITPDTLKEFQRLRPVVAGNRDLKCLSAAFNIAVLNRLIPSSPFRIGDVNAVKQRREESRTRRLQPGEAERLMAHARTLAPIITAALETGCRKGELLSMQWSQIRFHPRAEIFIPAQKTKAKKDRRVPISSVLRQVLEARQRDPAGQLLPPDAYVFGDEIGRRRGAIKSAWRFLCKRAGLVDLHFHDLRREAGSRWMDAGRPLGTIQRWLGHHNISQTSTYLGASIGSDDEEMRAYEERIGRGSPVTFSDIKRRQNDQNTTASNRTIIKNTEQNRKKHDPGIVIH